MNVILAPGIALINHLRYPQKFSLILFIMLIPMLVMGYLLFSEIEKKNSALAAEQTGLAYFSGIRPLIQHIPQHRGLSGAYLNGASDFREKILAKQAEIDAMFEKLKTVDQQIGSQLSTGDSVTRLKADWVKLKSDVFSMTPKQSFNTHTSLIAKVIDLGSHVADTSGLILDPVLDSYYMMDLIVMQMPRLTEGMGQSRAIGSGVAAKGEMDKDSWANLKVRMDRIRTAEKAMNANNEVIFRENPQLKQALEEKSKLASVAVAEFASLITNKMLDAEKITITTADIFASSTKAINSVFDYYDAVVPQLDQLFVQRIDKGFQTKILTLLVLVGVLVMIGYLFASFYMAVINAVNSLAHNSKRMADGDLTAKVALSSRDEMSEVVESFNHMADNFRSIVAEVIDSGSQVATAAEELSAVCDDTSHGITEQHEESEQVATAVNEMSATVQEVSSSAQSASVASLESQTEASAGERVVSNTIEQINSLADGINQTAETIRTLEADSETIGTVVDVIRSIAEQTNLLALNAAIEAARAGEQGRGFAVVADEVRNLASKTQSSTEEIQNMVERLQNATGRAAEQMTRSSSLAEKGVKAAADAGGSLQKIIQSVSTISDMNTQIASAAEEQAIVAEEINKSIVNITQVCKQNTSGASQTSSASSELARLASHLQQLMSKFKVA